MAGIVGTHLVAQVGFIVKDIEETKKRMGRLPRRGRAGNAALR